MSDKAKDKITPEMQRILQLELLVDGLEAKANDMGKRLRSLETQFRRQQKRIADHQLFTTSNKLSERLESISQRMLAVTIKDAVCTEVARAFPHTASKLYEMQDMDDDFWIKRDTWTIPEWAEYISKKQEVRQ